MSMEHLDEFHDAIARAREASDKVLTTISVGALRAALARIRMLEGLHAVAREQRADFAGAYFGLLGFWSLTSYLARLSPDEEHSR